MRESCNIPRSSRVRLKFVPLDTVRGALNRASYWRIRRDIISRNSCAWCAAPLSRVQEERLFVTLVRTNPEFELVSINGDSIVCHRDRLKVRVETTKLRNFADLCPAPLKIFFLGDVILLGKDGLCRVLLSVGRFRAIFTTRRESQAYRE